MRQARLYGIEIVALALVVGFLMTGEEAANREAAERDAARTLASFEVPPDARPEPDFPANVQKLLRASESRLFDRRVVERHADWLVPGKPQAVLRRFARHQGPGWEGGAGSRSVYSSPEGRSFSVYLYWRHEVEGLLSKDLLITTTRLPGGRTAVRAEIQNAWLRPRSPIERVARRP